MTKSSESNSNEWHALPKKRYGETFGQYLRRISPEQEFAMTVSARAIGVMPRSIFESYIPTLEDPEE
jgi:hypothetical protein